MIKISKRVPAGRGLAAPLVRRGTTVELDWDVRSRSRFEATDSAGRALAVFLPRGSVLRGGDVLVAEDGSLVRVTAAPQPVLVVRATTPFALLRAAYHLGNRHVALELQPEHLKLEPDHVLADLLRSMQLEVEETRAPFEPEAGAYAPSAAAHGHGHDHGHGHGHGHRHGHDHDHDDGHGHAHAHAHAHGHACGHDHGHGQTHAHRHGHGHTHGHGDETDHRHDEVAASPPDDGHRQP
jgi:urease accessory protein